MNNEYRTRFSLTLLCLAIIFILLLPSIPGARAMGTSKADLALLPLAGNSVTFSNATGEAAERTSPYVTTIILDTGGATTTDAIVVNINAADITTNSTVDYTFANPTQVTFPIGSVDGATHTVSVVINDDQVPEGDEEFSLTLSISSGTATVGTIGTQTVTIKNNAALQTSLFWSDGGNINISGLDGSGAATLINGIAPRYIALDEVNGKIYWADQDAEAIQRADIDGTNIEEVVGGLPSAPVGVALDISAGKVYWSDEETISRANLDGSDFEELLFAEEGSPQDIGLDLINDKIYWIEGEAIFIADLADGANRDVFFEAEAGGLHVDAANNYLYWVGLFDNIVHRTELDTGDDTQLYEDFDGNLLDPRGIFADTNAGKLFWANTGNDLLERSNLDGSSQEDLPTAVSQPFSVATGGAAIVEQIITVEFAMASANGLESVTNPTGFISLTTSDGAPTGQVVSVDVTVNAGGTTATVTDDYSLITTYTIPAGTAPGTLDLTTLTIVDDTDVEADETLDLVMSNPVGAVLGTQTTLTYTIDNNDNYLAAFTQATGTAVEDTTPYVATVTLDTGGGSSLYEVVVDVTAVDVDTTIGSDYTFTNPTPVTFPVGSANGATQSVNVAIINETNPEGDETFDLQLAVGSGPVAVGAIDTQTVTIPSNDDDYQVAFTQATGTILESATPYVATVTLVTGGGLTTNEVVVDVTAVDVDTTIGSDYTFTNPTPVTFPVGSADGATRTVNVAIINDNIPEDDESFQLDLAVISGPATVDSPGTQTVTISSNDVQVEFVSALDRATERDATYNGRIVLHTGGAILTAPVVVDVSAANGSAASPTDYALSTTQVTFPAGSGNMAEQLVDVTIIDDQLPEPDEDFTLSMSVISGPAEAGAITAQDVTIINNGLLLAKLFSAGNVGAGNSNIIKSELDGSSPITFEITNGGISDIAVDDVSNTVFRSGGSSLYRHDLTTDTETTLALSGIASFFGVFDVDPFAARLYLYGKVNAADATNSIIVTDYNGAFISSDTITGSMIDMSVDPFGGYVYWTAGQTLYRLPLAGGTQESFPVGADMIFGSFDVDAVNSQIYFTGKVNSGDASNSIIETDLTGNFVSSFTVTGGVSDMAVDPVEGYVYRLAGSTLYRHLISTGSEEIVTIATSPVAQPFQIDVSYIDMYISLAFTAAETSGLESVVNPLILTLTTTNDYPTSEEISVLVSVTGGTATAADYTLAPSTLTIPTGTSPGTLALSNLSIVDDLEYEFPDETLDLLLSNGVGVSLSTQITTTYTILNNDNVPPLLIDTTPADDATGVSVDTDLVMVFNEAIVANTGNIFLYQENGATDILIETFDSAAITAGIGTTNVSNDSVTLNPALGLYTNTDYYVLIEATAIQDVDANPQPYAGISDPTEWNFTTNSETCGVTAGNTYTFGEAAIFIEPAGLGDIDCLSVTYTDMNHPNATLGLQTGEYWTITAVNISDSPASNYTTTLTITTSFIPDADDKLCRYTGSGWDCAASSFNVGQQTITRVDVTQFSDWAAGDDVGPTAVVMKSIWAETQVDYVGWVVLIGGLLLLTALLMGWRTRRLK